MDLALKAALMRIAPIVSFRAAPGISPNAEKVTALLVGTGAGYDVLVG